MPTGHANYSMYVNQDGVWFVNETATRDTVVAAFTEASGTVFEIRSNINEVWSQLSKVGNGTGRIYLMVGF